MIQAVLQVTVQLSRFDSAGHLYEVVDGDAFCILDRFPCIYLTNVSC